VSPDLENMGIAVGISLLSCIETELRLISFFSRHLGFLTSVSSDSVSDGAIEKFTPENLGAGTGIGFLSRRIAELLRNHPPPPWSALQNSVHCLMLNTLK